MNREQKRIAAARRSRRYWDGEMSTWRGAQDQMGLTYRWLRALQKVKRARGGGGQIIADKYLQDIANQMLWVAREISAVDQMTGQQAYDHYQARRKEWGTARVWGVAR